MNYSPFQTYLTPGKVTKAEEYRLDDIGFAFVRKCIEILETRGLEEEVKEIDWIHSSSNSQLFHYFQTVFLGLSPSGIVRRPIKNSSHAF